MEKIIANLNYLKSEYDIKSIEQEKDERAPKKDDNMDNVDDIFSKKKESKPMERIKSKLYDDHDLTDIFGGEEEDVYGVHDIFGFNKKGDARNQNRSKKKKENNTSSLFDSDDDTVNID